MTAEEFEPNLDDLAGAFGIRRDKAITTAAARMHAWSLAATSGTNLLRVRDVLYSWDARPQRLQNGALQGRVYAQPRGQLTRDIGGFKISADGTVLRVPAALRGVLPGADGAETSADAGEGDAS